MPAHAGFAAAIAVREHVLRIALQSGYANGPDKEKKFTEDLSGDGVSLAPDLFLAQPDINCEGSNNLLVVTLPMWGGVEVNMDGTDHQVEVVGEIELTITPAFTSGPVGSSTESSVVLDPLRAVITGRRWTAKVTPVSTPAAVASLIAGGEFLSRFAEKFRLALLLGRLRLPSIDASFLGPMARRSTSVEAQVRNGALLIGLNLRDATHDLAGDVQALRDFARGNDVAGVVHPKAFDAMLEDVHKRISSGAEAEGAQLDHFSVRARDGYFAVAGAVSQSAGTVNFSFHVVPSMYHKRPGVLFQYTDPARWVNGRTWPALGFHIDRVETDVDRAWWVAFFGEILLGILTFGLSVIYIEGLFAAAAAGFRGQVKAAKYGSPAARVRRTIPPANGIGVRVGLDEFLITESELFVGISVQATPRPGALIGPSTVPETYRGEVLRYILRLPSSASTIDDGLRIEWKLQDRTNNVDIRASDGLARGRLHFEFSASLLDANDFAVVARLYRHFGSMMSDLGTYSVKVHMREALPPRAYVRWRWTGLNPQMTVDEASDTWNYHGDRKVNRYSEWHRTDMPCQAVRADAKFRHHFEEVDRLPFSLRSIENHRKGLCPYCFFGGPAGINVSL